MLLPTHIIFGGPFFALNLRHARAPHTFNSLWHPIVNRKNGAHSLIWSHWSALQRRKGLYCFSRPTVVSGPWPEYTMVSSPSGTILSVMD